MSLPKKVQCRNLKKNKKIFATYPVKSHIVSRIKSDPYPWTPPTFQKASISHMAYLCSHLLSTCSFTPKPQVKILIPSLHTRTYLAFVMRDNLEYPELNTAFVWRYKFIQLETIIPAGLRTCYEKATFDPYTDFNYLDSSSAESQRSLYQKFSSI